MELAGSSFNKRDFVWAKLTGFKYWPAIIMKDEPEAPPKKSEDMKWVYFLGTHNYSWVKDIYIKPFEEFKFKFMKRNDQAAVAEMRKIIENWKKNPECKIKIRKFELGCPLTKTKKPKKVAEVARKKSLRLQKDNTAGNKVEIMPGPSVLDNQRFFGTPDNILGILTNKSNCYLQGIIKNLINSGQKLLLWSQNPAMKRKLEAYADLYGPRCEVCLSQLRFVRQCKIIISCFSDAKDATNSINDLAVLNQHIRFFNGTIYIEMTSIGREVSLENEKIVTHRGGMYLEAMLQGDREEADNGALVVLAAGPRDVYMQSKFCFTAIGKASYLVGEVGTACTIHMITQMMKGNMMTSLAEGFGLAKKSGVDLDSFKFILKQTQINSEYLRTSLELLVKENLKEAVEPLKKLQTELRQGLDMSEKILQPMPVTSCANQLLSKFPHKMEEDDQDTRCVYDRITDMYF